MNRRQSNYAQRSRETTGAPEEIGQSEMEEGGRGRGLAETLNCVLQRWRLVLACVVGGAVLSTFAALVLMPRYTAKALLVFNDYDSSDAARRPDDGAVDTHIAMLTSHAHLDHVLAAIGKEPQLRGRYAQAADLERHLKVMQELRSHILSVNFTAKSPEVAAGVANEIAGLYVHDSLSPDGAATSEVGERQARRIEELDGKYKLAVAERSELGAKPGVAAAELSDADRRVAALRRALDAERLNQTLAQRQEESRRQTLALSPPIRIYALANPPEQTSSARPILIIVPALMASALFGVALVLMLDRFDPRIRGEDDLRRVLPLPISGAVPPKFHPAAGGMPAEDNIAAYNAAMQDLAVNIFLGASTRRKLTVMVTDAGRASEDNFVLDLAVAASRFKAVLLVVAGDENMAAHYAYAADEARRGGARITFSSLPSDQGVLLSQVASGALERKFAQFRIAYDWIVLATAPAAASPAARIMARMTDLVVVNVVAGKTEYEEVAALQRALPMLGKYGPSAASRRRLVFAVTNATARMAGGAWPSESEYLTPELLGPLARERVNRLFAAGIAWSQGEARTLPKNGSEPEAGAAEDEQENENVAIEGAMK